MAILHPLLPGRPKVDGATALGQGAMIPGRFWTGFEQFELPQFFNCHRTKKVKSNRVHNSCPQIISPSSIPEFYLQVAPRSQRNIPK